MTSDSRAIVATQEHTPVAGMAHDTRGGISNPILGMILFITSEVMFFAGLFAAYFNVRANAPQWPPEQFAHTLRWLPTAEAPIPVVTVATIFLIASSFTCQMGVWGIRRGDRTALVRSIAVTVILGVVFLLMQAYDYTVLGSEGLTLSAGTFGTTYYTLTGFHGAHVFGGVIMLSVILYRAMAGQFSARHHDAVEATSLYWHFVDVVWIGLFSTLYIL
ncbi:MAG: heme-copper oxidase subunit III [Chloroflexota bacterium]|jgi:cytochrome c oxidase subunit III